MRRRPERRNPFRRDKGHKRSVRVKPNEFRQMLDQLGQLPDDFTAVLQGRRWTKDEIAAVLERGYALDEDVARARWRLREAKLEAMRALPRALELIAAFEELAKTNPEFAEALRKMEEEEARSAGKRKKSKDDRR